MTITYIRWLDAVAEEASAPVTSAKAQLAELQEVGFLLDETDEAVLLGMEISHGVDPGRWRIHIPKNAIQERRDMPFDKAFGIRRRRPK